MSDNSIKRYPIQFIIIFILCILIFAGCSKKSNDNTADSNEKMIQSLQISSPQQTLANGTKNTLTATATYDDGSKEDVTHQVLWASENNEILTVSNDPTSPGLVHAQNEGTTNVTAHFSNTSEHIEITITPAQLSHIEITSAHSTISAGSKIQLYATGIFSDGSTQDITDQVNWSSNQQNIANFESSDSGLIRALSVGTADIKASLQQIEETTQLNITDPNLIAIELTPRDILAPLGSRITMKAIGIYSDQSKADITQQAQWQSSNTQVLSQHTEILNTFLPNAMGQSTITASINNISATANVTITAATLNQIEISPLNPALPLGIEVQIQSWGIYSDGSKHDITQQTLWTVQDASVASVSNTSNSSSIITPLKVGTTNINAQLDNKVANTSITVTQAQLSSITITAEVSKIANGQSLALTATGLFDDNSTQNITSQVTWRSSNTQILSVSNDSDNIGVIKGLQAGEASIIAAISGITGGLAMQVSDAVLERIDISSPQHNIPTGSQIQLTATGYYSDETNQDLTQQVTWQSADQTIIQIDNSSTNPGLANGLSHGQSRIDASYQNVTASIQLNVTNASLTQIEITSANAQIPLNSNMQFFATGIYSDGSTKNITNDVTWSSSDPASLHIQNADNTVGLANSKSAGNVIVTATLGDISNTISIIINEAILDGIDIKSPTTTIGKGTHLTLTAFANYSDGTVLNISNHVSWTSSDQTVLSFLENQDENGKLIAKSSGSSTVSANWNNKTGTSIISVHDINLEAIQIILDNATIAAGTHTLVKAIGNYADGRQQDLSGQVNWQSLDNNILTISTNPITNTITATAHTLGSTSLTASLSDILTSIDINVTASTLEQLTITPDNPSITLGETFQLQATGYFSDDTQQNLTDQVTWSISNETIATISNADGNQGLLSTLSLGTVELAAKLTDISTSVTLQIIDDPSKPVSIAMSANPNAILNDNQDQTQIIINLKAANSQSQVIDGTEVLLEVIQGEASLSGTTLTTHQGQTNFTLRSSHEGLVTVKATVKATNISNNISIFSTSQFANVVSKGAFATGQVIDGKLAAGTRFGYYIINLSSRAFALNGSRIFNEQKILKNINDPESLNNYQFNPGDMAGIIFITDAERPNKYAAAYYLTDATTSQSFIVGIILTIDEGQ